jgi:RNA polymerase sigma factor (sigma-70 family)
VRASAFTNCANSSGSILGTENRGIDTGILGFVTSEGEPKEIPYVEFVALRAKAKKSGHRDFSEEELAVLLMRVKRKEHRASELLILIHERFVFKVLRENKRRKSGFSNVDLEESMQEGRIAVLRAAETHDPTRGKFITHLFYRIRAVCRKHNSGDPIIRIEPNKFGPGKSYPKADPDDVAAVRNVGRLDDQIDGTDGLTIGDMVRLDEPDPEMACEMRESKTKTADSLRAATSHLSARERTVLEMRWLVEDGATLEESGRALNVTREGARLIEAKAFAKIRRYFEINKLEPS